MVVVVVAGCGVAGGVAQSAALCHRQNPGSACECALARGKDHMQVPHPVPRHTEFYPYDNVQLCCV